MVGPIARGQLLNHDATITSRGLPRGPAISDGSASFDPGDWAWEFLRRNPD